MRLFGRHCPLGSITVRLGEGDAIPAKSPEPISCPHALRGRFAMCTPRARACFFGTKEESTVRRFASLGIALILAAGTLVPVVNAQSTTGKTVVMGFTQEPDTFVAGEGNEYVTQLVYNLVCNQGLVGIDDLMRPFPDLAVTVPTLDNGEAVMVGDGENQHL